MLRFARAAGGPWGRLPSQQCGNPQGAAAPGFRLPLGQRRQFALRPARAGKRAAADVAQKRLFPHFPQRRTAKTLADLVVKKPFTPEVGSRRALKEEEINDMRKRSLELLRDPLSSITVRESRQKQVTIPPLDHTALMRLYWRAVGRFRHKSVVGRRFVALCLERAGNPALHKAFAINEGFNHRFFFLIVHAWLLHQRLTLEGWEGEMVDDQLFDHLHIALMDWLWIKDTPQVRFLQEVKHCQAHMYGFLMSLGNALEYIDILPARIHETLWFYLYGGEVNPDEEYIDLLTKYVLRQWAHVLQLEREHVLEGMFAWADFPAAGVPRTKVIHPFAQSFANFGYEPRVWDRVKRELRIRHKRTEMICLKGWGGLY